MGEGEVLRLIEDMKKEWTIDLYDFLTHNCCHFCEAHAEARPTNRLPCGQIGRMV